MSVRRGTTLPVRLMLLDGDSHAPRLLARRGVAGRGQVVADLRLALPRDLDRCSFLIGAATAVACQLRVVFVLHLDQTVVSFVRG